MKTHGILVTSVRKSRGFLRCCKVCRHGNVESEAVGVISDPGSFPGEDVEAVWSDNRVREGTDRAIVTAALSIFCDTSGLEQGRQRVFWSAPDSPRSGWLLARR